MYAGYELHNVYFPMAIYSWLNMALVKAAAETQFQISPLTEEPKCTRRNKLQDSFNCCKNLEAKCIQK